MMQSDAMRIVMQAFTFYASEDKLTNRGNKAGKTIGVEAINRAAAKLAKEVKYCLFSFHPECSQYSYHGIAGGR